MGTLLVAGCWCMTSKELPLVNFPQRALARRYVVRTRQSRWLRACRWLDPSGVPGRNYPLLECECYSNCHSRRREARVCLQSACLLTWMTLVGTLSDSLPRNGAARAVPEDALSTSPRRQPSTMLFQPADSTARLEFVHLSPHPLPNVVWRH